MGKRPSEHPDFLVRQQRRFRNLRRWLSGQCARPVFWILQRTPISILRLMARGFGRIGYLVGRADALRHLELAFGDKYDDAQRRKIAKTSCRNLAIGMAESIRSAHCGYGMFSGSVDDIPARASVTALEAKNSKGWIALTGHIGNWELLGSWVQSSSRSDDVLVVAKRLPNQTLSGIVERLRTQLGVTTVYQDESPARAIRFLRQGGVVGIVPDQDVKSLSGMFVEFFGRPAYTPIGPARIAIAAGVPILPVFMLRDGASFRVECGEPILPDPKLSRDDQIAAITLAWTRTIEDKIREHPEQWSWIHKRWKTTPEKLESRGRRRLETARDASKARSKAV